MKNNIFYAIRKINLFLDCDNNFSEFNNEFTSMFDTLKEAKNKLKELKEKDDVEIEEIYILDNYYLDSLAMECLILDYGSEYNINKNEKIEE